MHKVERRSFLQLAMAALPSAMLGQSAAAPAPAGTASTKGVYVASGTDREGKARTIGVSSTTYKVLTDETAGAMFVMEQANRKKGGPPRHFHLAQDELFFVLEGEYIVEIGPERFHLKAGDCVLGPRMVPHAWAFVGEATGRMLLTYCPAGKMEAFFNGREAAGIKPGEYVSTAGRDDLRMREHGMERVGGPIKLD